MESQSLPPESKNPCSIQDVRQNIRLWHKIRVLLFDLRHFAARRSSRNRLELVIDPFYIGAPYFDPSEAHLLKHSAINDTRQTLQNLIQETLDMKLSRRKRVESADFRPCAAHDLAPIFERYFNVKPKDLQRDKKFIKDVEQNGLEFPGKVVDKEPSKSSRSKVVGSARRSVIQPHAPLLRAKSDVGAGSAAPR